MSSLPPSVETQMKVVSINSSPDEAFASFFCSSVNQQEISSQASSHLSLTSAALLVVS